MQDKHTPGPWRIGRNYGAVVADHPVPEMSGSDHVEAYGGHMVGESIAPRNRQLIAAAPELAVALRRLLSEYIFTRTMDGTSAEDCETMECVSVARAALAKATGSAQ